MHRTTLIIISLCLTIIGIIALFFLRPDISPQYLQLSGEIISINAKEKVTFITFVPDDFLVVSFEKVNLEPGKHKLTGRLQQYKGRVEFIVEDYD